MNDLKMFKGEESVNDIQTISSREVAEMMEKQHKEIMWMIEGNERRGIVGIKPTIDQSAELRFANYFIESSYKDTSGKSNKYYECTKSIEYSII